jgi:lipoprotein-anchoring transpeptidase ErfK/SrfK
MLRLATTAEAGQGGFPPAKPAAPSAAASQTDASDATMMLQVLLDRARFSPGVIDGIRGANFDRAVAALARSKGASGVPSDAQLVEWLGGAAVPAVVAYTLTETDVAGPFTPNLPDELPERAGLPALNYENALEGLAERFHADPVLLKRLNPDARFAAGEQIRVPNVDRLSAPVARGRVRVTVSKAASTLLVIDGDTIIFAAPVTTGSEHDPLPIGAWTVTAVVRDPPFHYNPDLFWDANPRDQKARLAPGPNNPVGTVWIDLSKEHYGLHGTPEPSKVGHTASHGCVRLTNWDAMTVAGLVQPGTPVVFSE